MPPVKPYSINSKVRSKRKRTQQLAEARKKRVIEGGPDNQSVERVSAEPCANVVSVTESETDTSDSTKSNQTCVILLDKTRIQYKNEYYEQFVNVDNSSTVDISNSESEQVSSKSAKVHSRAIVDLVQLDKLVASLCCPLSRLCKTSSLQCKTDQKRSQGLAVFCDFSCLKCQEVVKSISLACQAEEGRGERSYLVNKQAVYAALACGHGSTTFNNLCECLDLQGLHTSTFHKKADELYDELPALEDSVFSKTVKHVRQVHAQQAGVSVSDEDIIDITVSYDGTWLTCGHSSHIGVGCVVNVLTGMCIDAYVMCTYCQTCHSTGATLWRDDKMAYAAWVVKHLPVCDKNFDGSSGMMEVEAARVLWKRSVDKHKLRYTTMLSDGDSKTLTELNKLKPSGER